MKKITSIILIIASVILLAACGKSEAAGGAGEAAGSGDSKEVTNVTIEMENGGIIKLELYPDIAPITVANFVKLAKSGFYDGLIFHRVINGFMIQGGDPEGTGMGGSDETIKGEFSANGVKNDISHERGLSRWPATAAAWTRRAPSSS